MSAVSLRRGVIGLEEELASSLYLASIEAERLGRLDEAQQLDAGRADAVSEKLVDPRFRFAKEVESLFIRLDKAGADDLARRAEAAGDLEIVAAVRVAAAELDESLDQATRIGLLERTLTDLDNSGADERG